jgi:catechol 2,3-dioxygenase-like lactoylglutathione lyase family enzyme
MDHETARALLHDLAARTLIAAYVEEDGGRSLTKVDPITGEPAPPETEPGEIVRAVLQWHGAGWAGEIAAGWHCFVDDRYLFAPGGSTDLRKAVDQALAMVDEADAQHPGAVPPDTPGHLPGAPGLTAAGPTGQIDARAERADTVGDLRLATVVVDVQDMQRAATFWCAALGYRPREKHVDPALTVLIDPTGWGLPLSLQVADAPPKEPVRLHLDLYTSDQAGQVDRLVGLGASKVPDWPYSRDADFVVLRDPDGNEFCVIDQAGG